MKAIEAFVELVDADGAPRVSVAVTLQHFRLSDGVWVHLASVTTDDAGKARLRVPMLAEDGGSAPALRLVRADSDPVAVLSEGGRTVYAAATGVLSVEFGRLRTIDSTEAPALVPRFRPAAQQIGALPAVAAPAAAPQFDDTLTRRLAAGRGIFVGGARARVETDALVVERNKAVLEATQKENDIRELRSKLDSERVRAENAELLVKTAGNPNNPAMATFQSQLNKVTAERNDFSEKFQARERELDLAKAEREQLRKEAERKAALVAAFEAERKQIVPIATLATNVQSQIAAAQTANAEKGLMRISAIKVRVRGKLGDNGAGITLPGNDAVLENAGGTLDEVAFEIDAPDTEAIPQLPVPDVIRLTETAARQVLASLGFRTDAIAGGAAAGFVTGQAVRQSPAAGTLAPRGGTVLIVFAG
jgi:hypothetical protein